MINSPTLLLPQWHALLEQDAPCAFHGRSLPRDVSTRWNSTYDHLVAFLQLQVYVDKFASVREHGLREFELTEEEWDCLRQLVRVLQVRCMFLHSFNADESTTDIKRGHGILLVVHTAGLFSRSSNGHHRPRLYDGFDG